MNVNRCSQKLRRNKKNGSSADHLLYEQIQNCLDFKEIVDRDDLIGKLKSKVFASSLSAEIDSKRSVVRMANALAK